MNPQVFNSFLDGTKSAIEMAAVANATGLSPPAEGLAFPPCGVDDLPHVMRPRAAGGQLAARGVVEVVSRVERDGRPVRRDLRWGVYVVIEAPDEYVRRCFHEYGLHTDASGRYAATSRRLGGLPIGPAHGLRLRRAVAAGQSLGWDDVEDTGDDDASRYRREMEAALG